MQGKPLKKKPHLQYVGIFKTPGDVQPLKAQFAQKGKFRHYPLTPMLMESRVKFCSPKNTSGASQPNSVAAFSSTTEVHGNLFENIKVAIRKNGPPPDKFGGGGVISPESPLTAGNCSCR